MGHAVVMRKMSWVAQEVKLKTAASVVASFKEGEVWAQPSSHVCNV